MSRTAISRRSSEGGFTLAGLIVVITIMMVFVAYTVPRQWSMVMQRERDKQAIFCMKQYARAIAAFQKKNNGAPPTSLDQLKDARRPRYVRGPNAEWIDPLTGEVDWILIPPGTQPGQAAQPGQPGYAPGADPRSNPSINNPNYGVPAPRPAPGTGPSGQPGAQQPPGVSSKDYVGPFVGVRPNKTGQSFITFNGADQYENWTYTVQDLQNEITARRNALLKK